jgi:hypothetical protein
MADVVAELSAKAGVSPDMARKGLGAILTLLKDKLPANLFAQVQEVVPNANSLMTAGEEEAQETSGGIVGAVSSAIGKLVGGGGAAALASKLTRLGFSTEQVQKFLPSVLEFLKSRLPANVTKQLSGLLPADEAGS